MPSVWGLFTMPTEVSGEKYGNARNGQEKSWKTLFRRNTEGCWYFSADIRTQDWYLKNTPALTLQREKSGTPASGHHVKQANSLCRMSESWARQMMRRTMVSQLQDVGTKTMIERVNNPAIDTEANNGSLRVGRWSAATLWTMMPQLADDEGSELRITIAVPTSAKRWAHLAIQLLPIYDDSEAKRTNILMSSTILPMPYAICACTRGCQNERTRLHKDA